MTHVEAFAIMKENCRKADRLGHRRNSRIPVAVVEHDDGSSTVAYVK